MYASEPLHLWKDWELSDARVSAHSRWHDEKWFFENPTAGQDKAVSTIRWDFDMPDGSRFTDPQWGNLLDANRRLVWSLLNDSQQRQHYKPGTIGKLGVRIPYFARWMATAGYADFGELDDVSFDEFAAYLVSDKGGGDADGLAATYLMQYLSLPIALCNQASVLAKTGIPVPSGIPWHGKGAFEKAKELATDIRGSIPPVPDEVFLKAMAAALSWLDRADEILSTIDAFLADKNAWNSERMASKRRQLRDDMNGLSDGCLIIVQGLIGMRVSELLGLHASATDAPLPDCVRMRPSSSGLHELFFVRGRVFKTVRSEVETEWIAGLRPVGSNYLPPPVRALAVLDRMYRTWRQRSGLNKLVVGFVGSAGISKLVTVPIASWVNRCQRRFFANMGILDWDISSHQWRKAFAQYVIRADSRMLPVLREHFKHVSIAMTEQGYINADPELRQIFDDAAIQATVSLVADMIGGRKRVEGPLVTMLRAGAERLGMSLGNRSEAERLNDIEEIVRSTGMRAWEIRWGQSSLGTCLFRQGTGNCTESCPARWVLRAPLWSAARPDLCWECRNLVVDNTHADFWTERLAGLREDLSDATERGEVALAALCTERIAQCLMILSKLGITEEATYAS